MNKTEIESSWSKGGGETDEATGFIFIHESELENIENHEIFDQISANGIVSLNTMMLSKKI